MSDFWRDLAIAVVSTLGVGGVLTALVILNPQAVERWAALVTGALYRAFGIAHRRYVQYDIQVRVNEFTSHLSHEAPYVANTKVAVEWASEKTTREAFLRDGRVVIRLRKEDERDENFVHAAYLFVSATLLHNVKRYLSQSQRESTDLYVTTKLLEREKPELVSLFLDDYLHPRAAKSEKVAEQLAAYEVLNRAALYYEVLLQELHFLGRKVFGKPQNDRIIAEVTALTTFLKRIAERREGDEQGDLDLQQDYCRVAVVIVGKELKITESGEAWIGYIRRVLLPKKTETIYLLGPARNGEVIERVYRAFESAYEHVRSRQTRARLKDRFGTEYEANQYVLVMRARDASVIQAPASSSAVRK